jgi:hypothetical protein
MKLWIPIVLVGLAVLAYAFYYALGAAESQGASSFDLANSVGLIVVVVGVVAAGFVIRRARPPE